MTVRAVLVDDSDDAAGDRGPSSADQASGADFRQLGILQVLRDALELHVGRGGRWTAEQFAEAVGIKPSRLRDIMLGRQRVDLDLGVAMLGKLGAADLNAALAKIGYEGAHQIDRPVGTLLAAVCAAGIAGSQGGAEALAAAEDGRIDHRERTRLIERFARQRDEADRALAMLRDAEP